jgi:lysophospholipase L1-like esterase
MKNLILIALILSIFLACGMDPRENARNFMPVDADVYHGDSISALCANWITGTVRAIPGSTSKDMLNVITQYAPVDNPSAYHILIGTNDITQDIHAGLIERLEQALTMLEGDVYVMSILPTNYAPKNEIIRYMNEKIRILTELHGHTYLNAHDTLANVDGSLNMSYSYDGLHLNDTGCKMIFK